MDTPETPVTTAPEPALAPPAPEVNVRATKSRRSAFAWYFQRISGLLLVLFTLGHFFMVHWTEMSGHDFNRSVDRLSDPIFQFLYLGFIVLGMYHGVQGMWNILRDFKLPRPVYLGALVVLIGAALFFTYLGFDTVLSVHSWKLN